MRGGDREWEWGRIVNPDGHRAHKWEESKIAMTVFIQRISANE